MSFSSHFILIGTQRVAIGSLEHLIPIALAFMFSFLLIIKANKSRKKFYDRIFELIGVLMSLTVIAYHLNQMICCGYSVKKDLPLYLCSLLALIIPFYVFWRKYWMFEILLFWVIAGTLNAVITPDISEGFPSLDYFRYWVVHLGLLFIVFYSVFVFKMKPTLKSVFKSFGALQCYVIIMVGINYLLDANYFYLNEKPQSATLLDHFGEWPWYIVVVQIIVIPLFMLIYLAFYLRSKRLAK